MKFCFQIEQPVAANEKGGVDTSKEETEACRMALVTAQVYCLSCSFPRSSFSTHNVRIRRRSSLQTNASIAGMPFEEGDRPHPAWTGDTLTSRLVATVISFKPLYRILKLAARQVLVSTAQKNGIAWKEMAREILTSSEIREEKETLEDPSVVYPPYYLNQFHAYEEGNLCWEAAAEVEAATMSLARRTFPSVPSTEEATKILRGNWLQAVEDHHKQYSGDIGINDVLDIGCSVGVSTRFLADKFPFANVTGLDLSPYFLAVAQYKEKKGPQRRKPIKWLHAKGEETGLSCASFDIVSLAYVIHECPEYATKNLLKEAYRILRPGGTVALTDNSPKSKIVQNLPPALFTLMKSTEPFLDEYYTMDLERTMEDVGFTNVRSILTDPRHRTVTGSVPKL
eukprot:TRINITY_DN219_c0_g1_i1.p1 TRINITY_DN219_c0_g1~~TRINITY_DN219_c0_g1_i1.p1  ORF type:complete len:397 (+),score=76.65 TRINITY_DN219_c0_g1_i1:188-1378(+)